MTLEEGQRVKLAADLRLTGSVVAAGVGSLSLASGTEGTVERVDEPQELQQSHEVGEYVRLKSLLDDFGHQMPPASRKQLEEQIGALEPDWIAHQQQQPRVTVRVRLDNGFVLEDAHEDVFTPDA
ncbi:hypothetical protein DEJ50_31940 [Streptomyces venezuelae]|uniref:Uncharacterized protein n=1 Tax=Streptomyces venezuelae TaxID=54571 RepID=A0A5P2DAL2_STRVZ|nr:hypothetical protein [Streptomyces venezuelae]QES51783.1 hypothetical protein DEJ50_31940 [Streptomyces venezuelae]